jgi:tRNA dimethylallyltransferase
MKEKSILRGRNIVVVLGPTASGKSDLAVKLARKFNGEVVSADSRQVYKGLDIGSGKITKREMRGVKHHLLDVAPARSVFTASRYRTLARRAVRDILRRGKLPIVAGGTGFYVDVMLYDTTIPKVAPNAKLRAKLEKKTNAELFARLAKLDPRRASEIDQDNKPRLVRALEIVISTGKPVPAIGSKPPVFNALKMGIKAPSRTLKRKIHLRLAKRLKQGMLREVEKLHDNGLPWKRLDDLGLEYRFVSRHLRQMISRKEMIAYIEKESWRYAKRQMTWWRRGKDISWIKNSKEATELSEKFLSKN